MILKTLCVLWLAFGAPIGEKEKITVSNFMDSSENGANFKDENSALVQGMTEELKVKLLPYFTVVESQNVEALMDEIEMGDSGLINEKDRISLGDWDGARYELRGSITEVSVNRESGDHPVPWAREDFSYVVVFKLVEIKRRRVVFGDSIQVTQRVETIRNRRKTNADWPKQLGRAAAHKIAQRMKEFVTSGDFSQQPGQTYAIELKSFPSPANVDLDGLAMGRTPLKLSVKPGIHKVRIYKVGFLDDVFDIKVEKDMEYSRELEAKK